jgi:hypothetical protein
MMNAAMSLAHRPIAQVEPNHRQERALARIEIAISELGSVLLSCCREPGVAGAVIRDIRNAVTPVVSDVLSVE